MHLCLLLAACVCKPCLWHNCVKCYIQRCVYVGRLVNLTSSISHELNVCLKHIVTVVERVPHICVCVYARVCRCARGVAVEIKTVATGTLMGNPTFQSTLDEKLSNPIAPAKEYLWHYSTGIL